MENIKPSDETCVVCKKHKANKLLGHAKTDMTVQYYLIDDLDDMQYRYNVVNG